MLIRHILLEDSDSENRQRCVEKIVYRYEHWIEDGLEKEDFITFISRNFKIKAYLSTKPTEERIPEMAERKCEILVEKVPKELAHPKVAPPTVNEKEPLEVSELRNGVIAR